MNNGTEVLLKEMNKRIDNINTELKELKKDDLNIIANENFKELGSTLLASIVGSLVTILVFKKQEKYKIKHELKREFYEKYNKIYEKLFQELSDLERKIKNLNEKCDEKYYLMVRLKTDKTIRYSINSKSIILEIVEKVNKVNTSINTLCELIKSNPKVMQNYRDELFIEEKKRIEAIYLKTHDIPEYYSFSDNYNPNGVWIIKDKTPDDKLEEFNDIIKYIINSKEEIQQILEEVSEIHKELENEFIGKYFKKNRIKKMILTMKAKVNKKRRAKRIIKYKKYRVENVK